MTNQCRMGYAPAIDYLPLEPRKAHVTPNRSTRNADDEWESEDWTHVGMHTVQRRKPMDAFDASVLRTMVGKLVKVEWVSEYDDWPYFVIEHVGKYAVKLRGADFPDGSAMHDGSSVFATPDEFKSVEEVQQSINGAATCQAFGEKHVAPDATPPSTTDKPQGVWVKLIERKPPSPGKYKLRRPQHVDEPDAFEREWDGHVFLAFFGGPIGCPGELEWLDETPQADAGWIPHDGGPCPVPANTRIAAIKQKRSGVCEYGSSQSADSFFWEPITAYRIVKEPA